MIARHGRAAARAYEGQTAVEDYTAAIVYAAVVSILVRDCFAAPIRFYASGIPGFWVLPDLLLFVSILMLAMQRSRLHFNIIVLCFVLFASTIGLLFNHSVTAVSSGIKMILPLIAGLYIGDRFRPGRMFWLFAAASFAIICAGVLYNLRFDFPWTGQTFVVGGREREFARLWWTASAQRIAGLGTDSTLTAFMIMIFAVYLTTKSHILIRTLIFAASIYFINITTSKTPQFVLSAILCIDIACAALGSLYRVPHVQVRRIFFRPLAAASLLFPFLAVLYGLLIGYGPVGDSAFSFVVRSTVSWVEPQLMILRDFPLGLVSGIGIGTVGSPILFSGLSEWFDPMNQVDNFAFAIYLMFGIPGYLAYIILLKRIPEKSNDHFIFDFSFMFLLYGTTILGFSNATFGLVFGMILSPFRGVVFRAASRPRPAGLRPGVRPRAF